MRFVVSLGCLMLMCGMVVSAAAPAGESKRVLDPNSITLLNNVLDHLKDTKHALDEAAPDKVGHSRIARHLLDQCTDEVIASKKALLEECGAKCSGAH